MTFSELIKGIKTSAIIGEANVNITGVEIDSRKVKEGNLFVAIKGTQVDGHQYIPKAIEQGAAAILCEEAPQQPQTSPTLW